MKTRKKQLKNQGFDTALSLFFEVLMGAIMGPPQGGHHVDLKAKAGPSEGGHPVDLTGCLGSQGVQGTNTVPLAAVGPACSAHYETPKS